ncbi:hypothetical protein [Rothia nasimurium]|uniref:hypothetical protein n=1 Tax=Rothia nasimurium TaxID=85336 RepID=UPI001F324303|nr:hypothetical protein [Rothia nasimurium]
MTAQPYTADQILAAFSKGLKGTRMKAMAQEIAGLANKQVELNRHISYLESLIDANGGKEALDLSRHIAEAQQDLQSAKQGAADIENEAHARAREIIENASFSLQQQKAEVKQEALQEAQQTIEAEIARVTDEAKRAAVENAEKEAERILAKARADAFRVANQTWIQAQADGNIPPNGLLMASARLRQELEFFGRLSGIPGEFVFLQDYQTRLRETKPYLENCIEIAGKPAENGLTVSRTVKGRIVPRYHEDNGDPSRMVSVEVDGKVLGWLIRRDSENYRSFLLDLDSMQIEIYANCEVKVSSTEKRGSLSAQIDIELHSAAPIQRRKHRIRDAIVALSRSYPTYKVG